MPGPGYYWIGKEEEAEVLEVLRSKYLFRYGDPADPAFKAKVATFERMVCDGFGVEYALGVSSGTAALVVALSALGVGPGDEVICPGYTYIASISSVIAAGAVPVLAEVDDSFTLDPDDVESRITPRTRAIMVVHMLGASAQMDRLLELATKRGLTVIEDTAQAFGGSFHGARLGSLGDVGTYSFNIFKMINAGDGGMVTTGSDDLYLRAFGYHDQGHKPLRTGVEVGERSIIGLNFRMTELTGAVLIAQFRKLESIIADLRRIKDALKQRLDGIAGLGFRRLTDPSGDIATVLVLMLPDEATATAVATDLGTVRMSKSGWHVYQNMENLLSKRQVAAGPPFRSTEYPTDVEYTAGMLPRTDALLRRSISLSIGVVDPGIGAGYGLHPMCGEDEIKKVANEVLAVIKRHV